MGMGKVGLTFGKEIIGLSNKSQLAAMSGKVDLTCLKLLQQNTVRIPYRTTKWRPPLKLPEDKIIETTKGYQVGKYFVDKSKGYFDKDGTFIVRDKSDDINDALNAILKMKFPILKQFKYAKQELNNIKTFCQTYHSVARLYQKQNNSNLFINYLKVFKNLINL